MNEALRLPHGMPPILQARLAGHRPAYSVHVTDDREIAGLANRLGFPVVYADPLNLPEWDWSALRGLDVVLVYRPSGSDPVGAADRIMQAMPKDMTAIPIWQWVDAVAPFFEDKKCN